MTLARLGGVLLIVGSALTGVVVAIALSGAVGLGGPEAGWFLAAVTLATLGAGAGAVSLSSAPAFRSRLMRVGLGLDAVGLIGLALSGSANTGPDTSPLLLVLLLTLAISGLGLLVTLLALVRTSGWLRITGVVLVAGFVGLALAWTGPQVDSALRLISTVLLTGLPLGSAGVGLLAVGLGTNREAAS